MASCLAALALTGGLPQAVPEGLPDAGALTGWALRIVSLLATVAAVGTVGSLVVAAVLLPARSDGGLVAAGRRAASAAGRWATGWAVLTAVRAGADGVGRRRGARDADGVPGRSRRWPPPGPAPPCA